MQFCFGICDAGLIHLDDDVLNRERIVKALSLSEIISFTSMTTERWLYFCECRWLCIRSGTIRSRWVIRCMIAAMVWAFTAPSFNFLLHQIIEKSYHSGIFVGVFIAVVMSHVLSDESLIRIRRQASNWDEMNTNQWNVFFVCEDFSYRLILNLFCQTSRPSFELKWSPKLSKENKFVRNLRITVDDWELLW